MLFLTASLLAIGSFGAPTGETKYCLVLDDSFDGDKINPENWKHEVTLGGGGNWEMEWYTDDDANSYVRDGKLYLKPSFTKDFITEAQMLDGYTVDLGDTCTNDKFFGCKRSSNGNSIIPPIRSAKLKGSQTIKYGRVEVRAKMPIGDWLWPAVWMLPKTDVYGEWPRSGEIDIMENRGNSVQEGLEGVDYFGSTLHWGASYETNRFNLTQAVKKLDNGKTYHDDFHTFGMEWTKDYIKTYLDTPSNVIFSQPIANMWDLGKFPNDLPRTWPADHPNAPFDTEFYLIMNLAVGGINYFDTYAPKNFGADAKGFWNGRDLWEPTWGAGEDRAMIVDSVKIWKECGTVKPKCPKKN
jgi:beta-glucanase (GH16 family)